MPLAGELGREFDLTKPDFPIHSPLANQKYSIELHEDGHPRFPVVDVDLVAPNDARLMLKGYIELTWSEFKLR